ncbi:MAG: hypothetical protein ACJ760_14090 [Thermoleophilaceae bacterium]
MPGQAPERVALADRVVDASAVLRHGRPTAATTVQEDLSTT